MVKSVTRDLTIIILSLLALALLWIPNPTSYPLFLFSYLLILITPGYTLVNLIKSSPQDLNRALRIFLVIILNILLIFIFYIVLSSLQLTNALNLTASLLLILSIIFAIITLIKRPKSIKRFRDGQLTLDEAIERATHMHDMVAPPEESHEEETKENLSEKEPVSTDKLETEDMKPIQKSIISNNDESQTKFPENEDKPELSRDPLWKDELPQPSGPRSWDLISIIIFTLLISGFIIFYPISEPIYGLLIPYLLLLTLASYSLTVIYYPTSKRMKSTQRVLSTLIMGLLVFSITFLFWRLQLLPLPEQPLFYLLSGLILILTIIAFIRRRKNQETPKRQPKKDEEIVRPLAEEEEILVEDSQPIEYYEEDLKEESEQEEADYEDEEIIIEHDEETLKAAQEAERTSPPDEVIYVEHDDYKSLDEEIIPEHVEEARGPLKPRPDEIDIIIPEHAEKKEEPKPDKHETVEEEIIVEPEEPPTIKPVKRFPKNETGPSQIKTKNKVVKSIPTEPGKKERSRDLFIVAILTILAAAAVFMGIIPESPYTSAVLMFIFIALLFYNILTVLYPKRSGLSRTNHILIPLEVAIGGTVLYAYLYLSNFINPLSNFIMGIMIILTLLVLVLALITRREQPPEEGRKLPPTFEDKIKSEDEIEEEKESLNFPWLERQDSDHKDIKKEKVPDEITRKSRPWDLVLIATFTLLTVLFVLVPLLNQTPVRTVLGILLVLFIPGYSLIAALFPKKDDLDGIERVALSFGLSIAVTPLIGLALNYTPWGIRLDPILVCLTGFTLVMCIVAYVRRNKLPVEERFSVPFHEFTSGLKGSFNSESRGEKILTIVLVISIVLAMGTTAYVIVKPKQGEKFTEFYILGPNGKASDYPTNLTVGQNASLIIGVVNHEYAPTNYRLVVKVENATLKDEVITLQDKEKKEIPFTFTASGPGEKKMEFLLYKLPDESNVYRDLHLYYRVT